MMTMAMTTMMRTTRKSSRWGLAAARTLAIASSVLFSAATAGAQEKLREAVSFLMTNQAVQTGDFARDQQAAEAAHDTIARALLVNMTSAPIGTSSGGFLYRLNPELGTVERVSENFGTFFVERAMMGGAGSTSFGMTAWTAGYDRLNGFALRDGSFVTVANQFRGDSQPFDTESLTMRLRTSTMTFFGNVGVTDEVELGAVVPIARIDLEGERLNTYNGSPFLQATAAGSASGIGDIALRAKYGFFSSRTTSLAAAGELRLPTGDEENLLGAGSAALRLLGIVSFESGPIGLHGNAGIVRGGVSDEFIFSGAFTVALHPRATLTTEVMRRDVTELRAFEFTSAPHPSVGGVDTLRMMSGLEGSVVTTAATGIKWNLTDTVVMSGQILWSLNQRGLTAPLTPVVSLEYSLR
jgi:hypothetical protein